ncbi:MAG: acetyl-CoA carboxylase biotin carboxyl carrier protein [Phycisphaerales bacterium JB039]
MIDIRKLKELVKLMVENDLSELDLQDQQETVTIKRGGSAPPMVSVAPMAGAGASAAPAPVPATIETEEGDDGLVAIESPMVGTFYSAPDPDSGPFVKPGQEVSADSVVCLVEAMKVFNEIKAEITGRIEKVLVGNGDAVEFGQKLFLVKPA